LISLFCTKGGRAKTPILTLMFVKGTVHVRWNFGCNVFVSRHRKIQTFRRNLRKIDFLCTISICFTFCCCFFTDFSFLVGFKEKKGTLCIFYTILWKKIGKNNLFLSSLQTFLILLGKKIEKNFLNSMPFSISVLCRIRVQCNILINYDWSSDSGPLTLLSCI